MVREVVVDGLGPRVEAVYFGDLRAADEESEGEPGDGSRHPKAEPAAAAAACVGDRSRSYVAAAASPRLPLCLSSPIHVASAAVPRRPPLPILPDPRGIGPGSNAADVVGPNA